MTGRQPRAIDANCSMVISWASEAGVAMGQLPARSLAAENQGHPQRPVLVGQPADLAVLALDGHQNDQVARAVGFPKTCQIRLATATEIPGKRVNGLVRVVEPAPSYPPDGAISV